MPTGYTAGVESGEVTTLRDFAMGCARAFGALISMRDDPPDAPVPEEFRPSNHYPEQIKRVEGELVKLESLSLEEVTRQLEKEQQESRDYWRNVAKSRELSRARYLEMLEKVKKWTPPSKDHEQLKTFMISQLELSLNGIVDIPPQGEDDEPATAQEWLERQKETWRDRLTYYQQQYDKELEACRSRTEWVRQLRESLKD